MPPLSPPLLDVLQNMFGSVVRSVSSAPEAAWENMKHCAWTWHMQERQAAGKDNWNSFQRFRIECTAEHRLVETHHIAEKNPSFWGTIKSDGP